MTCSRRLRRPGVLSNSSSPTPAADLQWDDDSKTTDPALSNAPPNIVPRAVLFDMDGTLTTPALDFPRIKQAMGIDPQRPILEALAQMSPAARRAAEDVLNTFEEEAARTSTLNPGCREVLALLDAGGIRTALITRNSRSSVTTVLAAHGLQISVLISRDDAPPKPDPEPLFRACRALEVPPGQAWMVGDGEFDVQAGLNAGCPTVWLSHRRDRHFPEQPWRQVDDLWGLIDLLDAARSAE